MTYRIYLFINDGRKTYQWAFQWIVDKSHIVQQIMGKNKRGCSKNPYCKIKPVNGFESHPMQVTWKKSTRSNFFLHTFQKTIKFSVLFVADASLDNALPPVALMTAFCFSPFDSVSLSFSLSFSLSLSCCSLVNIKFYRDQYWLWIWLWIL